MIAARSQRRAARFGWLILTTRQGHFVDAAKPPLYKGDRPGISLHGLIGNGGIHAQVGFSCTDNGLRTFIGAKQLRPNRGREKVG